MFVQTTTLVSYHSLRQYAATRRVPRWIDDFVQRLVHVRKKHMKFIFGETYQLEGRNMIVLNPF